MMNCGEITMALKKCVDAHPEYYGKLSEAPEKETEKKEAVTPAEAPAEAPEKVEAPKEEAPVTPVETPWRFPRRRRKLLWRRRRLREGGSGCRGDGGGSQGGEGAVMLLGWGRLLKETRQWQ